MHGEGFSISAKFPLKNWEQMDEFLASTHGSNHVLRNRPLFDWFFRRDSDPELANLIVAYRGAELVSLLGYLPTKFLWGDEIIEGAWMAHWMTKDEFRTGIGALLMRKITEVYPVVVGQGASRMNQEIVSRMNFHFLEQIPKVVFIFATKKLNAHFGHNWKESKLESPALLRKDQPIPKKELSLADYAPDWSRYPTLRYSTLRDAHYLRHRYLNYPFLKYHLFIEGPPETPALCVVRVVKTTPGITVGRILEFLHPDTEQGLQDGRTLIVKVLNFLQATGCDFADFYSTGRELIDTLLSVGFIEDRAGLLPSLLDPIDLSRKYQNLEVFVADKLRAKYPNCREQLFVTRADGDQDRPNASFTLTPGQ